MNKKKNVPVDGRQENKEFKKDILAKLTVMREKVQPLLYDTSRPERNEFVQRANFLYALMFKIKDEYKPGDSILDFVDFFEKEYPLATKTISEVKNMPELQSDYLTRDLQNYKK